MAPPAAGQALSHVGTDAGWMAHNTLIQVGSDKPVPNFVHLPDGSINRFATPEETPALMTEYMDCLNTDLRRHLASPSAGNFPELLARQHTDYIRIHLFDDGNGVTLVD